MRHKIESNGIIVISVSHILLHILLREINKCVCVCVSVGVHVCMCADVATLPLSTS